MIKYGLTTAFFVYTYSYISNKVSIWERWLINISISDGFAIPGLLLTCSGLLLIISNEGAFDGISWGLRFAIKTLIPFGGHKNKKAMAILWKKKRSESQGFGFVFVLSNRYCNLYNLYDTF